MMTTSVLEESKGSISSCASSNSTSSSSDSLTVPESKPVERSVSNQSIHDIFVSQDLVSCSRESLHSSEKEKPTYCLQRSRVTCRGELQCRSQRWAMLWRSRYFNLKGGVIEVYKCERDFRSNHTPLFRGEVAHAEAWKYGKKAFGFKIETTNCLTFHVCAENKWNFMKWLNSLTGASSEYQSQVEDDHIKEEPHHDVDPELDAPCSGRHVCFVDEAEVYSVRPVSQEFQKECYYSNEELMAIMEEACHNMKSMKLFHS